MVNLIVGSVDDRLDVFIAKGHAADPNLGVMRAATYLRAFLDIRTKACGEGSTIMDSDLVVPLPVRVLRERGCWAAYRPRNRTGDAR